MEPISAEVIQQVADYFSVLSEPMRLKILNLLGSGEKCVQDLVDVTETSQANVSKHLKVMMQAGILTRRTEGTSSFYRVADELSFQLCNLVCDRIASRIEEQAKHFRAFSFSKQEMSASEPDSTEAEVV
ncbi:MAG: metalloregulator ArsR/SmtB family transcription factor [Leptolyngbyaceae cyanobacterium MAG.088]|nr:metalloregulator ArsR/SmtB family transcription factor [Leptolyngbyaceae cyanobacterium MAG.088]